LVAGAGIEPATQRL